MKSLSRILVGVLAVGWAAEEAPSSGKVDYTGHKLVKIYDLTPKQHLQLVEAGLDSWGHGKGDDASIFRLAPDQIRFIDRIIKEHDGPLMEVINENVQDLID